MSVCLSFSLSNSKSRGQSRFPNFFTPLGHLLMTSQTEGVSVRVKWQRGDTAIPNANVDGNYLNRPQTKRYLAQFLEVPVPALPFFLTLFRSSPLSFSHKLKSKDQGRIQNWHTFYVFLLPSPLFILNFAKPKRWPPREELSTSRYI